MTLYQTSRNDSRADPSFRMTYDCLCTSSGLIVNLSSCVTTSCHSHRPVGPRPIASWKCVSCDTVCKPLKALIAAARYSLSGLPLAVSSRMAFSTVGYFERWSLGRPRAAQISSLKAGPCDRRQSCQTYIRMQSGGLALEETHINVISQGPIRIQLIRERFLSERRVANISRIVVSELGCNAQEYVPNAVDNRRLLSLSYV